MFTATRSPMQSNNGAAPHNEPIIAGFELILISELFPENDVQADSERWLVLYGRLMGVCPTWTDGTGPAVTGFGHAQHKKYSNYQDADVVWKQSLQNNMWGHPCGPRYCLITTEQRDFHIILPAYVHEYIHQHQTIIPFSVELALPEPAAPAAPRAIVAATPWVSTAIRSSDLASALAAMGLDDCQAPALAQTQPLAYSSLSRRATPSPIPSSSAAPANNGDNVSIFSVDDEDNYFVVIRGQFPGIYNDRSKYPLATVEALLDVFGHDIGGGYDIGCKFRTTLAHSDLGERAAECHYTSLVGAFHGHAHNRLCQLSFLATYIRGLGLEDLEGCEQFFSKSNALASSTCYASIYHHKQKIVEYLEHMDCFEMSHNLSVFLVNNYYQALEILNSHPAFEAAMVKLGIEDVSIFETWLEEEHQYLAGLSHEPLEETQQMAYYQALVNLENCKLTNYTGYKLCKHIGNALKQHSQAISTALDQYNIAAWAMNPPRKTLEGSLSTGEPLCNEWHVNIGKDFDILPFLNRDLAGIGPGDKEEGGDKSDDDEYDDELNNLSEAFTIMLAAQD
ncbi:hypothetical protein AN958_08896 [Leucoagaricus sp. SymC.cos]|nr:hypothetical protein AN958_08896 [Leucoagaricus sp. SymC.cos]